MKEQIIFPQKKIFKKALHTVLKKFQFEKKLKSFNLKIKCLIKINLWGSEDTCMYITTLHLIADGWKKWGKEVSLVTFSFIKMKNISIKLICGSWWKLRIQYCRYYGTHIPHNHEDQKNMTVTSMSNRHLPPIKSLSTEIFLNTNTT